MRRAWQIGFSVAILLCGGLLLWQRSQRPPKPPEAASGASEPAVGSLPPPRLALAPQRRDAGVASAEPVELDEQTLLQQIRANVKSNPPLAETLAREGRARFPNSPDADERDALLVDALINQQRIGAARSETYYYFDHHPGGRFANHLFAMTGVHPSPAKP
jgi:hypothetical protein